MMVGRRLEERKSSRWLDCGGYLVLLSEYWEERRFVIGREV